MPRAKGSKNETPANADVAAVAVNDAFSPGADWRSIKGAAEYLGFDAAKGAARIRAAIKSAPAFGDGAVKTITIEGYDIPPIVYVHTSALDAYRASMGATGVAKRGPRGDTKRAIIDVPHAVRDAVFAALAEFGITPREASAPKRAKSASNNGDGSAPVDSTGAVVGSDTEESNGVYANADAPADDFVNA